MTSEFTYNGCALVAAELLKTLKRDVPFETEADILDAHTRLTQALITQSDRFQGQAKDTVDTPTQQPEVSKATELQTKSQENKTTEPTAGQAVGSAKEAPSKAITTSEPAVLAMVQKAVDAVATKEGCIELKAKILKATKISLQDQSALLAKLDARMGAM